MNYFLSCDWGTSTIRIRLVESQNLKVVAEEVANEGIATTFAAWQGSAEQATRQKFYLDVIKKFIVKIEDKIERSLNNVDMVISGMASSTIGFIDIPYSLLPFGISGDNLKTASIPSHPGFGHNVLVISGVKTNDDVMRGEETQLIGCIGQGNEPITDELFIFPGTHSKHIRVVDDQIISFNTYMTGEFFELLSQKSILRTSVELPVDLESPAQISSFKQGVSDVINANLLNTAFKVRTNNLFDKLSKEENFSYLSGLLIATELKDLEQLNLKKINLVCGSNLKTYYLLALNELGLSPVINTYAADYVDQIVVHGHYKILYNKNI